MKKFSKILENNDEKYFKIEAKIELLIPANNEGEASYKADSILAGVENKSEYVISNVEKCDVEK